MDERKFPKHHPCRTVEANSGGRCATSPAPTANCSMPPPRLPLPLGLGSSSCCFRILRPPVPSPRCILLRANPFAAAAAPPPVVGRHPNLQPPSRIQHFSTTAPRYEVELPSTKEGKRSSLAKSLSDRLDHMQAAIFMAGQKINDLTGYSGIEALKRDIDAQEARLVAAKATVKEAKAEYKAAIARRSDSQKEVNELLQRKNTWSPTDLERFTELYRSDHANEQAEIQAQNRLTEVEKDVDRASGELSKSILTRYHEEQVWSDKIRRASTWGTWMLMGFNIVLFIVVQLGLEPWKRRRLVNNFEEKVRGMLKEEKEMIMLAQGVAVEGAAVAIASEPTDASMGTLIDASTVASTVASTGVLNAGEEAKTAEAADDSGVTSVPTAEDTNSDEHAAAVDAEEVLAAAGDDEGYLYDPEEEGMDMWSVTVHRLRKYFREERVTVPQIEISLWVIEGFVAGALTSITIMATFALLDLM
ncbi:hypothetical protein Dda_2379 [Drechslerella dactyloides]|uniref:Sensitive to high expression protein 9, mitochondrial n=1 Tax=Drechslerella dactyloides TaxID=74499 RepID=A0AAD6J4T2_DREDA|nr:hypothetical protein Dda_2379 [Drechslerella dactyloides]